MSKDYIDGFFRLNQIVRCKNSQVNPLIPISTSAWWDGIKKGKYPAPIKIGPRTTVWRASEIKKLIEDLAGGSHE